MKIFLLLPVLILLCSCKAQTNNTAENKTKINSTTQTKMENKNIYDITVKDMDGKDVKLSDYKGKVLLIVNVASQCGYTPQYEGLEKLYQQYKAKGFEILGFPCNDFGGQEPGTNEEIKQFCESKYNVTFKLFDKVKVLGDDRSVLYSRLINNAPETGDVGWNFEKFLIDKNGNIAGRFKSKVKPESEELISAINTEIAE
ncbi:MAG: glutathione peroxidase [Ignavibacteria bacterium]|nr:glutathione peroxidase [Ignavibacteria bacterium]